MSALLAEAPCPRATVIAIHGGATTSAYYDCPGQPRLSLLRLGAALGFTVIALDRPGFGASAPHADLMADPRRRVELSYAAVQQILGCRPRGSGLFLVGHSAGCELALQMAVGAQGSQVLGLEIAGTGRRHQPAAREILRRPELRDVRKGVRELLWQAAHLYPAEVIGGAVRGSWSPAYEAAVVANWSKRDFAALAEQVRIPVRFSLADHEPFWESGPAALANVGAMFTASPRVVVNEQRDSGHNLSLGFTAAAYHLGVLSFAEECVVAGSPPETEQADHDLESEAS
ncbi:MAG: alpha/beta fold hydrolase [Mycobacteriaceae bacterium]|nr:alpha/beta fold hydrolase [Mycobacteriaceae bacterium]